MTETQSTASGVEEVHILWISEGLSCDGDSVSITAATLPSIEDVLLGNIPGLPKVHLHNKVLAYENGDEYMRAFYQAKNDELDAPFVLVIEGSIPNENISGDGFWTSFGFDHATGQPITLNQWIDWLAPKAWAVVGARDLRDLRRHPRDGRQPHGRDGAGRLPRVGLPLGGWYPRS